MKWTARDWRQFSALLLLALASIPLTGVMSAALWTVAINPANIYAFWLGQSAAALVLTNLVGLSAILGRRTFRFKVGDNEVHATGEDADKLMERTE